MSQPCFSLLFTAGLVFLCLSTVFGQNAEEVVPTRIPAWQVRASVLDLYDPFGNAFVIGVKRRLDERCSLTLDGGPLINVNSGFPQVGWKIRAAWQFYAFQPSGNSLVFHGPELGWKRKLEARGEFVDRQDGLYREYLNYRQTGHDLSFHYQLGTAIFPRSQRLGFEISGMIGARGFRYFVAGLPPEARLADPDLPLGINPREGWVIIPSAAVRMLVFLSPWLDQ